MQPSSKTRALALATLTFGAMFAGLAATVPAATAHAPACPASGAPIKILQLEWADHDRNGHLDAVLVHMSAPLDKATVVPNDFIVPALDDATRRATAIDPAGGGTDSFWLTFRESSALDAGWAAAQNAPSVTFSPPDGVVRLRALAFNPGPPPTGCSNSQSAVPTATEVTNQQARVSIDRASPILMAAHANPGDSSVTAVFSEPVSRDGGSTCSSGTGSSCFAGSATSPSAHFCYVDAAGNWLPIYGVTATSWPSQTFTLALSKSITGATTTASSNTVTVSSGAPFTVMDIGRSVAGTNIPSGTTITAVNSPSSITISQLATGSSTSVTLTISSTVTTADTAVHNVPFSATPAVAKVYFGHFCAAATAASSDTTLTGLGPGTFLAADVGRAVSGPGVASGATIATVAGDGSTATMSAAATGTVRGVILGGSHPGQTVWQNGRDRAVDPDGSGTLGALSNAFQVVSRPNLPAGAVAVGGPYPVRSYASAHATAGLGDTRIVVEFSGPVASSAGTAVTGGFVFSGTPPPSVAAVSHSIPTGSLGSNRVTLTADQALETLTDGIVIHAGAVKGAGTSVFTPGSITWPLTDIPSLASPRIVSIQSQDGVGGTPDGCLDGVKVTFSEAVTGGTSGWTAFWPSTSTSLTLTYASGDGTKSLLFTHPQTPCQDTSPTSTPRVSLTGTPPADTATNQVSLGTFAGASVADASAAAAGATTLTSAAGHFRPDFVGMAVAGTGIAAGTRVASVTDHGTIVLSAVTTAAVSGITLSLAPVLHREPSTDGAAPYVFAATTADCQVRQPSGTPLLTNTGCSPNGRLDGVTLLFSEPVATFRHQGWTLTAPAAACTTTGTTGTYTLNGNASLAGNLKLLRMAEISGIATFNTACVPEVAYSGTPALTDAAGNAMGPILAAAAIEADGAGPVLVELQGAAGSTFAQALFSERACGWRGPSCPGVQPSDLVYRATAGGSIQSLVSVQENTQAPHILDLTLPAPLTSNDLTTRCIEPVAPLNPGSPGSTSSNGISDAAFNLPFPRLGQTPSCRGWINTAAPRVVSAKTVDSNRDGFLDAVRLELSQPILAGSRILRHAAGTTPSTADTAYYDADGSRTVTVGDYRFNAFGALPAASTVATGNADVGTSVSTAVRMMWADLGPAGASPEDVVYADVDGNLNVTHGDIRYRQAAVPAPGTVSCGLPRSLDCGHVMPAAGYTDVDRDGFVGHGEVRSTTATTRDPGQVSCSTTPDPDCGRALTPTTFNLKGFEFQVDFTPANVAPTETCATLGKGAGPVLNGTSSSCPDGVLGVARPPPGFKPSSLESCAGALAPAANDSVLYVCFTPWRSTTAGVLPNTGQTPKVSYTPGTTPAGGTIRASSGLPLGPFNGAQAVTTSDDAAPVLVEVLGSPGDAALTVVFSEPVGKGGDGRTLPGPLDFAYINGNAGSSNCPGGADTIANVVAPNATQAQWLVSIVLPRALSREDVVGCIQNEPPATSTPARDALRLVGTGFMQQGGGPALVAASTSFTFRDTKAPTVAAAAFIDPSGDGIVDAVRVTFSEPVNDCFAAVFPAPVPPQYPGHAAFCTSTTPDGTHVYGWGPRADDFQVKVGTTTLRVRHVVTGQDSTGSSELCRASYPSGPRLALYPGDVAPTFGPPADRHFNDNTVFLCLDPDNVAAALPNGGTKDLGTGITGTLTYTRPASATCDESNSTNRPKGLCDLANVGPDGVSTMPVANLMATQTKAIGDAARPVVSKAETADRDHDGKVDAVKVSFSEQVNPKTWTLQDWALEGRTVRGVDVDGNVVDACPASTNATTGKPWLWLCLDEAAGNSTFDTDIGRTSPGPRLSYPEGGTLRDKATTAAALRSFAATVTDGAEPAVVRVHATIDSATVTVTFSEGVDGTGGPSSLSITYSDLYYQDGGGTGSRASGFGSNQAVHSPGDEAAVLLLNAPVSQQDLDTDRICFIPGNIREHVPPTPALALFNTCVGVNGMLLDTTPPSPVSDLRVDLAASSATAIKLMWTAPNGTADNDLARYELRVCTCAITTANARTSAVTAVTAGLPTPQKGASQTYTYTPPAGWTSLNFTLFTIDTSDNPSMSNVVRHVPSAPDDTNPPGAITDLSVDGSSPRGDRATLTWTAPSQDAGTASSGAVASYRIYRVSGLGPITQADLVAGNQVGGAPTPGTPGSRQTAIVMGLSPESTYTFVVIAVDAAGNASPLSSSEQETVTTEATDPPITSTSGPPSGDFSVAERNQDIQETVKVERVNGTNVVTWELPDDVTGRPTQGVQVWRCNGDDTSTCELVGTFRRDTDEFRDSRFEDPDGDADDRYLVTAFYGTTAEDGYAASSSDAENIPGFGDLAPVGVGESKKGFFADLPLWVWIVAGAILLLLVALILWAAFRKREEPVPPAETIPGEGADVPMEETPAPAAAEGAAPPPADEHHITCPKCSAEFTVTGSKPLAIQCPTCGVKGVLR